MICDGCNKEHHVYCVSPPMRIIPDGEWYCPECQKMRDTSLLQCEDRNFTVGEDSFSPRVLSVIQRLQETVRQASVDREDVKSALVSLSVGELLQVQSCWSWDSS